MSFTQHRGITRRSRYYYYGGIIIDSVKSTVKDLFYGKALHQARQIQEKHKNRLLCGGLALKLYGIIDRTSFSDLDFIAMDQAVKDKEYISLKCATPFKHCLFLASYVKEGSKISGLVLQDLDQIIYHKMLLGRAKDIEDLKAYHERGFFTEEEFIVDI